MVVLYLFISYIAVTIMTQDPDSDLSHYVTGATDYFLSNDTFYDNATVTSSVTPDVIEASLVTVVIVSIVVIILAVVTSGGNLMVALSIQIDCKQLRTIITNYYLLSLSVADFTIGVISMPLFTVYLLMGTLAAR